MHEKPWESEDERKWERQDVLSILEELYEGGNWVRFPKDFLLVMTLHQAYFLSYLISVRRGLLKKPMFRERYKGWFFRKSETITKDIHLSNQSQTRLLRGLKKLRFIRVRMKGRFGQRLFWIDFPRIHDAIHDKKHGPAW